MSHTITDDLDTISTALDSLGLALVDHEHMWTKDERRLYDNATAVVDRLRKKKRVA